MDPKMKGKAGKRDKTKVSLAGLKEAFPFPANGEPQVQRLNFKNELYEQGPLAHRPKKDALEPMENRNISQEEEMKLSGDANLKPDGDSNEESSKKGQKDQHQQSKGKSQSLLSRFSQTICKLSGRNALIAGAVIVSVCLVLSMSSGDPTPGASVFKPGNISET